ncbi:hypothetical protein OIU77_016342 [Salix suchowensis]|uniref:Bacterial Ig-like domain-containing protein n=1 Tax=Salix suchowensis TaxID=1278906 RepID=A0ABQ8ZK33_9ROSI|nr:hypothetical protein OIU77_016342 [Salix suchowensis]
MKHMATTETGLLHLLKLALCIAVMIVCALDSTESTVFINFHQAPPEQSRISTAVFQYSAEFPDGSNACKNNSCHISCELDGRTLRSCPADIIVFKNLTVNHKHSFLLNVSTRNGERNSSSYSWFIDTIPPTATIFSEQNYTSAGNIIIDVTFSEACTGLGGFKCANSSNCDVILNGPAYLHASSLHIIKPNIKYRLDLTVSLKSLRGRILVRMADNFCTDKAGNSFTRTNSSSLIIHFDRRPVLVDLWMPVPSYVMEINGVPRTVLATNKMGDLKICLDFSIPIGNSTEEVLNSLHVNSDNVLPVLIGNHGNRNFFFELRNASKAETITVKLESGLVGRTGNPVSQAASLTILYDSTKPEVRLSTSSPNLTKASDMKVIVGFTKPVFGFEASMVQVEGGKVIRFKEFSRALYSLTVLAVAQNVVSITIPAGKVHDISGNQNLASNLLEVKHYSTPAISMALYSFVTSGVIATSLTAAALSLSTANLGAIRTLATGDTDNFASKPSMNLHGFLGHLQVFVLSDWLSSSHPIEYSETTKGLRWLIPRQNLPWKDDGSSIMPNHVYMAEEDLRILSLEYHNWFNTNSTKSSNMEDQLPFQTEINLNFGWRHGYNTSMKSTPYGLPLNSREYLTYFLRGEPSSASILIKETENYKGWQDLEKNLFWLGVGGGSLIIIHVLILLFLRWRTGAPAQGMFSVPRFELLLLILMLPCISQSSAFVMKGDSPRGILIGALLLVVPGALISFTILFLIIAIFSGSFSQYKEIRDIVAGDPWYKKLLSVFTGKQVTGKWFYREGLPTSLLPRFGILFENLRGPPLFVFVDHCDPNTLPVWIESGQSGIGRMRAVSSDDSSEETKMPWSRRFVGCARSSYVILDLVRRVGLGILSGAYRSPESSQSLLALAITLTQLIYLLTLKPFIRRRVHLVESISLLCEAGIFGFSIATKRSNPMEVSILGYTMLALLFLTFIVHIVNEWYALVKCLLRLSQPRRNSFRFGLKLAAKGLVLPFLPRKHWSRVIPNFSQPETGLSAIPPLSPESVARRTLHGDPLSAISATVVPVLRPGSPSPDVTQETSYATADTSLYSVQSVEEGKGSKGLNLDQKSELKKLRQLARASFSGNSKGEESTGTSYGFRDQFFSPKTTDNCQASTSKTRQ